MSVNVRDNIHSEIFSQFPDVYKENSEFLIGFIESYYKHLDEKMDRNVPKLRDIDTTLSTFLIYYKKKYLADLPIDTQVDIRFIVKHILDVYKRKGTEESVRLLFKMFFDEEIEVFYPSTSILRASDSVWGGDTYLELKSVYNVDDYVIRRGDRIVGDLSLASAFVDDIIFVNFSGALTPVAYLSNLTGEFSADDSITIVSQDAQGKDVLNNVGKLISGSISEVIVKSGNRTPGQKVGEKVSIRSSLQGVDAEGVITKTSTTETGQIEFSIEDGGFGYVLPGSSSVENEVGISNHVFIVKSDNTLSLRPGDVITAGGSTIRHSNFGATGQPIYGVTGSAEVIAYNHPLLFVKTTKNTPTEIFDFIATSYDSPINPGFFRNVLVDTYYNVALGGFVNVPPPQYAEPYFSKFIQEISGFKAYDFSNNGSSFSGESLRLLYQFVLASNTTTEDPIPANNFTADFSTVVGNATKVGNVFTATSGGGSHSARFVNTAVSSYPLWLASASTSSSQVTATTQAASGSYNFIRLTASFTGTQTVRVTVASNTSGTANALVSNTTIVGTGTATEYIIAVPQGLLDRTQNYLALSFSTENIPMTITGSDVVLIEDTVFWPYFGSNDQTAERWPAFNPLPSLANHSDVLFLGKTAYQVSDGDYVTIDNLGNMPSSQWIILGAKYGAIGEDFVVKNVSGISAGVDLSTVTSKTNAGVFNCAAQSIRIGDRIVITGSDDGNAFTSGYTSNDEFIVTAIGAGTEGIDVTEFTIQEDGSNVSTAGGNGATTGLTFTLYPVYTNTKVLDNKGKLSFSRLLYLLTRFKAYSRFVISDNTTNTLFVDTIASPYSIPSTLNLAEFDVMVNGDPSKILQITALGEKNDSASFTIGNVDNQERVTLIADQIGEFSRVTFQDSDYGMSGPDAENLTTTIEDAFDPITLTLGSISEIERDNPGSNYTSDVNVRVVNEIVSKFNKKDMILRFDNVNFFLREGDLVTQRLTLPGIDIDQVNGLTEATVESMPASAGSSTTTFDLVTTQEYDAKIKFLRRSGNDFYFRPMSFYLIDPSLPISIKGSNKNITSFQIDESSLPMGANARIVGDALYQAGQLVDVSIVKSGYKFSDEEEVDIINLEPTSSSYNKKIATADIRTLTQGKTEGRWRSKTSFLSEDSKRIHDNDYYQEYSYDISSIIDPSKYNELLDQTVSVAGTKRFSTPLINSDSSIDSGLEIEFTYFDITSEQLQTTDGDNYRTQGDDNLHASVSTIDTTTG